MNEPLPAAKFDCLIVSAFGRGHWMAVELKRKGRKVGLIDVSDFLGRWTPEDWDGPFGFFKTEGLRPLQQTRLMEEGDWLPIENGFQLLTDEGPIEFQGGLSGFLSQSKSVYPKTADYVNGFQTFSTADHRRWAEAISELTFKESWVLKLAHQMASPVYLANTRATEASNPLPIYSQHYLRRVTRKGLDQLNQWVRSEGVHVFEKSRIKDVLIQGRNATGFEVQSSWSGIINFNQMVWCLSSEETKFLNAGVAEKLFPKGILHPYWVWIRTRFHLGQEAFMDVFPKRFGIIGDLGLSWTHANMMLLQKTTTETHYDIWIRIPAAMRFQRRYLQQMAEDIEKGLHRRFPLEECKVIDWPQDYQYSYEELGPSRYPVFNSEDKNKFSPLSLRNVYYDSCETWDRLDQLSQFQNQERILVNVDQAIQTEKDKAKDKTL